MRTSYTIGMVLACFLSAGAVSAQNFGSKAAGHEILTLQTLYPMSPFSEADGDRGGPPANDLCTGAVNHNVPIGGSVTITGNNTGATDTEGIGTATAWERFTTTACSKLTVNYCGTNPAFGNFFISITIGCPFTTVIGNSGYYDCGDGNLRIVYNELPAGTYYIPVLTEPGAEGPYTINVSAQVCATPAPNNDCTAATTLTSNSFCLATLGSDAQATESLPANLCDTFTGNANDDVWFKFTATQTSHTVAVTGNGGFDAVVEAFSGSCSALVVVDCEDMTLNGETEQLELTGLTVGNTYYVRVFHWYTVSPDDNTFWICVVNGTGINIGVNEMNVNGQSWSIFPNPGQGVVNLAYNGADARTTIDVVDVAGRIVRSEQRQLLNGSTSTLDLNGLAEGLYTVRLTAGGVSSEQRLVVR